MSSTTKEQSKKLLKEWKEKLYASGKLTDREVNKRAKEFTRKGMSPDEN
jgi:hypothetical protein